MRFLVLSRQHNLLPFAHRLRKEGHDVEAIVYKPGNRAQYENAYAGVLEFTVHRGEKHRHEKIEGLKELAGQGECTVLTDDFRASRDFRGAQDIYCTIKSETPPRGPLRFGAWFDGSEFVAPHLLVVDEGAFPGGMGARCEAGLTMVRLNAPLWATDGLADDLKSRGFRGLCQWGVEVTDAGVARDNTQLLGWPSLHSHAFISELDDFGAILSGAEVRLPQAFVVVVRITRPPWPHPVMHSPGSHPIEGLDDAQSGQVFWHDVAVDQESRTMATAGLDGMVGIARGAAASFELARAKALGIAQAVQFPEKQYRPDVGGNVRQAIALLEKRYGIEV